MKERLIALRPWLIRIAGYPAFFTFFFLLFLYVTFPYERLRETIVAAVEAPRTTPLGQTVPSTMEISIGRLGPTIFPGLRAEDVRLTFLPTRPEEQATSMRIERAVVHVSILGLLVSKLSASFDIEGMGGEIEGETTIHFGSDPPPGLRDLELQLTSVRVGELAPLVSMVGLPLGGTMNGTVELHIPDGQVAQATGAVHLVADRLTVGDGHAQYQIPHFGGVTVEQIRAGRLEANVNIRRGVATIERMRSHSDEFDLQMDGSVTLRANFAQSALGLGVRFRLTDAYRNKSEQAGRILAVMDMAPDIRRARRPDGMLAFRCSGTLEGTMRCPPDPRAGGSALPSARPGFER